MKKTVLPAFAALVIAMVALSKCATNEPAAVDKSAIIAEAALQADKISSNELHNNENNESASLPVVSDKNGIEPTAALSNHVPETAHSDAPNDEFDSSSAPSLQINTVASNAITPLPNIDPAFSAHAVRYSGDLMPLTTLQVGEKAKLTLLNTQIEATLKSANHARSGNQHLSFKLNNGSNLTNMMLTYSDTGIRGKITIDGTRYHIQSVENQILMMSHKEYIELYGLENHKEKIRK
ncbi:hypothetical protein [Pseudoalteromonas ardens]|uniref:Lipoprotein n=1 Tax=Pseudoalteromonas rubra TaxID=43658 RepID=A0A0L0EV60_9GAMM|nr:hypothetical protein [Pseudoalteromonas sp. R96]KNC68309.1 hypothetical protein AC626_05680 [Pseudoalteromonas rubra]MDK1310661.1 hypothetical protein [Pseudoalteromonas sp. R96]